MKFLAMPLFTSLTVATDFSLVFADLPTIGGRMAFLVLGSSLTPVCFISEARVAHDKPSVTLTPGSMIETSTGTLTFVRLNYDNVYT